MNNIKRSFMYHYVRSYSKDNHFARFKDFKDFIYECKKLKKLNQFLNISDLYETCKYDKNDKLFLTFDDGLKEHLNVAEELKRLGLKGTFYISVKPFFTKDILPVHKAHLILSKIGPEALDLLYETFKNEGFDRNLDLLDKEKNIFINKYKNQIDDQNIKEFKRIINYYGNLNIRNILLNSMLEKLSIKNNIEDFYLNKKEIQYIDSLGFEIGSHSYSHTLLSRLDKLNQSSELLKSKKFLENLLNHQINSFCYPYGGSSSYTNETINLLKLHGYKNATNVEPRDINEEDIYNAFEIPRYDCNLIHSLYEFN